MLTLQPNDIFAENYRLIRLVDTGGFADVWEAVFLAAGNTVALKIFPRLDEDGVKNIEDEYRNQADLLHSNLLIARYFGKYLGHPFLEMRFCSGGNAGRQVGHCGDAEIAQCLHQVASALAYLHANHIIHQDIKPNNFLLDGNGNYYLADLGLSFKVRQTIQRYTQSRDGSSTNAQAATSKMTAGSAPPPYRAPELYERGATGNQPLKASDIWALGASLFELITGDVPLGELGGIMQIANPEPPELPATISSELSVIIRKCLAKDTWERPKAAELTEWAQSYLATGHWPVIPTSGIKQPEQPTPAPAPVSGPPKKKGLPAAVWIIAILVVAGGAFWGFQSMHSSPALPGKSVTIVPKPADTTAATPVTVRIDKTKVPKIDSSASKKPVGKGGPGSGTHPAPVHTPGSGGLKRDSEQVVQ